MTARTLQRSGWYTAEFKTITSRCGPLQVGILDYLNGTMAKLSETDQRCFFLLAIPYTLTCFQVLTIVQRSYYYANTNRAGEIKFQVLNHK